MPYGVLTIGHPDPRENARGGQSDLNPLLATGKHPAQEYTLQQNELVMRGMAQLEEDFLIQVLLTPVSMQDASRMLAGLAEYTSTWAAWQTGHRSFNIGTSLPFDALGGPGSQCRHWLYPKPVGRSGRWHLACHQPEPHGRASPVPHRWPGRYGWQFQHPHSWDHQPAKASRFQMATRQEAAPRSLKAKAGT